MGAPLAALATHCLLYSAFAAHPSTAPAISAAPPPMARRIQIGIVPRADDLAFTPEGRFTLTDLENRQHELTPNEKVTLRAKDGRLMMGDVALPNEVRLRPAKVWANVKIGERRYHGTLIVRANDDDTITAIEELGIEEYLLGVLPLEMEPDWPVEALKAQAVIARTYAYTQMGKYRKNGFDLTSDTRSQVYGGVLEDSPNVRKAVEQTRGEVLGYKGEILPVYYHACCGGHTVDAQSVWPTAGKSPPPLRGVKDRYCQVSPSFRWKVQLAYDEVLEALQKRRMIGGKLRRFEIGRKSAAGWVRTFVAKIGGETMEVSANDFRLAVGASQLKSAHITRIRKSKQGVEFIGGGSGHGVGLCQWGARVQAERGRKYEQILKFYFPQSVLSVIDE